jgi:hypothetical protein
VPNTLEDVLITFAPRSRPPASFRRAACEGDLTEAEWQMLMILREEAASEGLKITIIAEPGQWHVRLESHEQGSSGDGWGQDFSTAWEDIVDPRLRAKAKERD